MHYELDISGSGLEYRVGDCFGIVPPNDPADIRSVLAAAELSGDEVVTWDGADAALSIHLQRACIQRPTVALLKHIATLQPRLHAGPGTGCRGFGQQFMTAMM